MKSRFAVPNGPDTAQERVAGRPGVPVSAEPRESKAAAVAPQTRAQDTQGAVQGAGRAGLARRLLLEPGRLVEQQRACRRSGLQCLSVECAYQPGLLLLSACSGVVFAQDMPQQCCY